MNNMQQRQIARLWDERGDGEITEREFAGRLFDLYDGDKNVFIDPF